MKSIILPKTEKFHVKIHLHDINGEYAEKTIEIEEPIYVVRDTKKKGKKETAGETPEATTTERNVHTNSETNETLTRKVKKKVHAFPRNGINQPLVPLGTARGYITGVLVSVARSIGVMQAQTLNGILCWLQNGGVKVLPHMVALSSKDVSITNFFVEEAKGKIYFEQVKDAMAEFDVEVTPKEGFNAELVQELLRRGEGVGVGPKRRGYYTVESIS